MHSGFERAGAAALPDDRFLTTRWSIVIRAGDASETEDKQRALETLCADYWYPLYAYLRRQGKSVHDAQDLTQGFFERFLRRDDFRHASAERGRFRTYLLSSLRNFVANDWRRAHAQKRGGAGVVFSLEQDLEDRYSRELPSAATPETLYHKSWAVALLEKVARLLQEESARAGKSELFESLRPLLNAEPAESHAEIGARHGLTSAAVTMSLHRMRQRYGELLRREIAGTVASAAEVEDEIRFLLGALAS